MPFLVSRRFSLALCALGFWSCFVPDVTAQDEAAAVAQAMQQLQAGDAPGALAALDSLTSVYPESLPVWNAKGMAARRVQEHAHALTAFMAVERLSPGTGPNAFNIGVQQALLGDLDQAFEWLIRARDSGTVLTPNVVLSPASAILRQDERFPHLFPDPDSYAHPFVEDRPILQDWTGEQAGDVFGWIARSIGDVDGDGVQDMTASATGFNGQAGKVYVYSGGSGDLLWSREGSTQGGRLGHGIEAAGDVNADGIPDVVAAAPYINQVFVYSGRDGTELLSVAGADTSGAFGLSVKGIGDVNADGHGDLLIGEPRQVWGAPSTPACSSRLWAT